MASSYRTVDLKAISRVLRTVVDETREAKSDVIRIAKGEAPTRGVVDTASHSRRIGVSRPTDASAIARALRKFRIQSMKAFPGGMIADPAFDVLLEVFIADEEGDRISISKLLRSEDVPQTTTLRWTTRMEAEGILVRVPDAHDRRRFYVTLSEDARAKMHALLRQSNLQATD